MTDFIAEISTNHNGDLERGRRLIRQAARAGCAAIVFSLFRIENLFAPQILKVSARHRELRRWELPMHLVPALSICAREHGLKFGLAPTELEMVDLVQADVDFFKVSAHELPWLGLIDRCADTGLPLLISTGMANAVETWSAAETALEAGCTDLTMLHSVIGHPTPVEDCNLAAIGTLREMLVREFAPLYGDAVLKAGWSDRSVSTGVIARAVNHWGCDAVEFRMDLEDQGGDSGNNHCWLPDRINDVIAGGFLPVRRECDGTGRIAPAESEHNGRMWRADPADGLRPISSVRKSWPQTQPESVRQGPDVYFVCDGSGLGRVNRCIALAENLRTDHDADVLFLLRDTDQKIRLLERHGFNWARFENLSAVVDQIIFLDNITADNGQAICIMDLPAPADSLSHDLRRSGLATVVIGQTECVGMDLGLMPSFGWQNETGRQDLEGGTAYLLLREDLTLLRQHSFVVPGLSAFPRVLITFGGCDDNNLTTRTLACLHETLPTNAAVQVVLSPDADPNGMVAQILESRFPTHEIITSGDTIEPFLVRSDFVITAMGLTVSEAVYLGVPA